MLKVNSEISTLKKVIIHRPDEGVGLITPENSDRLLYDDIVYLPDMLKEHAVFSEVFEAFLGKENVLDIADLLAETLYNESQVHNLCLLLHRFHLITTDQMAFIFELRSHEAANTLISGVLNGNRILEPLPNYIFTRDIGCNINGHLILGMAAKDARKRESILNRWIFEQHPLFRRNVAEVLIQDLNSPELPLSIEGGDLMVVAPDHLLIGCSERTNIEAATRMKDHLLKAGAAKRVSIIHIPHSRQYMHLDTIFTQIGQNEYLVFEPLVMKDEVMPVEYFTNDTQQNFASLKLLIDFINPHAEFIFCGGGLSPFDAREQWTDGCNMVVLRDGVALLYDRNEKTAQALEKQGFTLMRAELFLQLKKKGSLNPENLYRTILLLPSGELSRARGGPHCMSFPLERE